MNAHTDFKGITKTRTATVDISELRAALTWTSKAKGRFRTIPVLGMHRFDVNENTLSVTTTDLDIEACKLIECEAKGKWSFLTNGARLISLLSSMSGRAELEIDAQEEHITLRADGLELTLNQMITPSDWPTFELTRPKGQVEVSETALHRALRLVSPCISSEATRYYLNGIFWTRDGEKSRMVATNGHQLARLDLDCPAPHTDVIIPRTATTILQSILSAKGNETVEVVYHGNDRVTFNKGLYSLSTKLIDGTFPDYTRVIPTDTGPIDVVITRETARRLLAVTDECSKACKISPSKAEVSVKLQNEGELRIPIGTQAKGGDDIGFHTPYLATLTRCAGDLRLRALNKSAAARLTNEDNKDLLYVLMPMRV
ncbi:DNA polymerase III subunit beta [Pseudophaeobacter sp.]|uniref:DNA polymerase III subunit beta n=1 Tax=Pseudophaeobacter sp. TaxID=1971739 RepID=UPI003A976692